jgi:hypothetical protein
MAADINGVDAVACPALEPRKDVSEVLHRREARADT